MPMFLAMDTPINIKTTAGNRVDVRVYTKDMTEKLEERLGEIADTDGEISFTFSSSRLTFAITTFIKGDPNGFQKFKDVDAKREVLVDLTKATPVLEYLDEEINDTEEIDNNGIEGVDVEVNIEESETEVEEEIIEENTAGITGEVIEDTSVKIPKIIYYVIGGLFIFGALIFIGVVGGKKLKSKKSSGFKVTQLSSMKSGQDGNQEKDNSSEIADAERKLEEARKELDEIKNKKSKLQEARERFEKAKSELEEAEKG